MATPDRPTEALSLKVERISRELRLLDPAERDAALDRVCAGDDVLRAAVAATLAEEQSRPTVESLVDDIAAAEQVLAFGRPVGARGDAPLLDAETAILGDQHGEGPGTVIGPYKVRERLGEGGFGSVFLADQERPVRRRVALKILKLGMDTRQIVARFEAERQALAMMDHPCIAKVFDAGATATGRPYFVMELVRGEPITQYCNRRKLSVRQRLELLRQVCDAVHHAHQKGIIHRDLKPSNILVTEPEQSDSAPTPRVIDFGIAKATSGRLGEQTIVTEIRQMIGTPEYMSPEQAGVTVQDVDTRTDVYSLGVILYELLAGSTPFDSRRLRAAAYGEIQRIIREEDPPRPSTRVSTLDDLPAVAQQRQIEPERLRAMLRGEIDWIVMKCLEKDRTRRYGSAAELGADLARFLANQPITARPASLGYTARKLVQRNRGAVAAAAAVLLVLLIGVAGTAIGLVSSLRANRRLDLALAEARQRADELSAVAEFQAAQLKGIEPDDMARRLRATLVAESLAAVQRDGVAAVDAAERLAQFERTLDEANLTNVALTTLDENIFGRTLAAIDQQFKSQPLVQARMLQTISLTLSDLGLVEKAVEPMARALTIRRTTLGDDHPDTIDSLDASAYLLMARGRHDEAEPVAREAVERATRVLGSDHRLTLTASLHLGGALRYRNRLDEAEAQLRAVAEATARLFGAADPDTIDAVSSLGQLLYSRGKLDEAEPYYRATYEGRRAAAGEHAPETLRALSNLGVALGALGRLDEAARCFREAWTDQRRALGDDHPDALTSLQSLANILMTLESYDEAAPLANEVMERSRRTFGDAHPKTLGAIATAAAAHNHEGRFAEALALVERAEPAARRAWGGRNGTRLGAFLLRRADALHGLGRFADTEKTLLECHALYTDTTYGNPLSGRRKAAAKLVALYEAWERADPGRGHGAEAETWRNVTER